MSTASSPSARLHVRTACHALQRCIAPQPTALRGQLAAEAPHLISAFSELACELSNLKTSGEGLALQVAGTTVGLVSLLDSAFRVLSGIVCPCISGSGSCTTTTTSSTGLPDPGEATAVTTAAAAAASALVGWTPAEGGAVHALLQVASVSLQVVEQGLPSLLRHAPSHTNSAVHTSLARLADRRPWAALKGLLLLTGSNQADLPATAVITFTCLLLLATRSPQLAGALSVQEGDAQLTAHACRYISASLALPSPRPGSSEADDRAESVDNAQTLVAVWVRLLRSSETVPEWQALYEHYGNSPEVGRLLLAALKAGAYDERPNTESSLHNTLVQTYGWFASHLLPGDAASSGLAGPIPSGSDAALPPPGHAAPVAGQVTTTKGHLTAWLTAEHVFDISRAMAQRSRVTVMAFKVAHTLREHLSLSEQARSFLPAAQLGLAVLHQARRAMTLAPRDHTQSDPSSSHPAAAALPRVVTGAGAAEACDDMDSSRRDLRDEALSAMVLMLTAITPPLGDDIDSQGMFSTASVWDRPRLSPRARWVCRSGAVEACEALLRAAPDWLPTVNVSAALSLTVASLLMDDPLGPQAASAFLTLIATQRKQLRLCLRAQAAAAVARVADPDPAVRDGSEAGSSVSGREGTAADLVCTGTDVLSDIVRHGLLRQQSAAGALNAHHLMLRCVVLQLLPLAVCAAHLSLALDERSDGVYTDLLKVLAAINHMGMADLTAAAGAPRLLHSLLTRAVCTEQRWQRGVDSSSSTGRRASSSGSGNSGGSHGSGCDGSSRCAEAVYACRRPAPERVCAVALCGVALVTAGADPAWRAQSRRWGLPGLTLAGLSALTSHAAAACEDACAACVDLLRDVGPAVGGSVWPDSSTLSLSETLRSAVASGDVEAQGLDGAEEPAALGGTPECCMLAAAAASEVARRGDGQKPPAACLAPFFGCWNLRCTNLDGVSEVSLKTRKCAGCLLARYCSEACQRRAWRCGHRAACQAWRRQHDVPGSCGGHV